MIYIEKDNTNVVVFTLTDFYSGNTSAIPMVRIKSNQLDFTKDLILGTDLTSDLTRYNFYEIKEDIIANEDLSNGVINLPIGTYDYEVYEVNSVGVIISTVYEIGLITVEGLDSIVPTFTNNNNEYTFQ